ncbi:hypothetical protein AABB24_015703 [Solanum stoloniferum]|uniref:Uncharacterized protein n=1 Tax=Solanum stoloniferum TaxID=62892 RepID=A0ABD2TR54_9SOLN
MKSSPEFRQNLASPPPKRPHFQSSGTTETTIQTPFTFLPQQNPTKTSKRFNLHFLLFLAENDQKQPPKLPQNNQTNHQTTPPFNPENQPANKPHLFFPLIAAASDSGE